MLNRKWDLGASRGSIIEATPEFNSRIVADLDEKKAALSSRLKTQLKKAKNVPLDILLLGPKNRASALPSRKTQLQQL